MEPDHIIDDLASGFDDIENEIKKLIEKSNVTQSGQFIYQIPVPLISKENKDVYTPRVISIGPIHHNDRKLEVMEKHKILYCKYFRARADERMTALLLDYEKYLVKNENLIRSCYSKEFPDLNHKTFVRMILLDAIFIMELFLSEVEGSMGEPGNMERLNLPWGPEIILRDLVLLENQLPFFVLVELYKILNRKQDKDGFLGLARRYFKTYDPYHGKSVKEINNNYLLKVGWDVPKHFTDLIRSFYIPPNLSVDNSGRLAVKPATEFKRLGITFEPISNGCLLDITYRKKSFLKWLPFLSCLPFGCVKDRLLFPQFIVNDSTEDVLRNVMVFEQCHYPYYQYICGYASLLDLLIREEKDAAVLVENGVIVNELKRDKDLTSLINRLCENIEIKSSSYGMLSKALSLELHNNAWAEIKAVYFRNLWTTVPTIVVASVLLKTTFDLVRSNVQYCQI